MAAGVGNSVNAVFRRADEGGLMVAKGLDHGFGIADGHADAEGEQQREVRDLAPPGSWSESLLGNHVKDDDRYRGEKENRHIDDVVGELAEIRLPLLVRVDQEAKDDEQKVCEIGSEVGSRFHFHIKRYLCAPDGGQYFFADLDGPLGPAVLLALETVHVDRKFSRGFDLIEEDETPALELGAVAEIHVFGQCVVLPTSGISDARFAPDPAGAIEGEESARAVACGLLQFQMAVEKHGLDAGQHVECAVQVAPSGLDHPNVGIGEVMDGFFEQFRFWHEIGVQNQKVFALGGFGAVFQCSRLEPGAIGAVDVFRIETALFQAINTGPADVHGLVGGIIEQLDLDFVLRVIKSGNRIEQAVHDVHFIEDRKLHGHQRQIIEFAGWARAVADVLEVEENDRQAVGTIAGKAEKDEDVADVPNGRCPVHGNVG